MIYLSIEIHCQDLPVSAIKADLETREYVVGRIGMDILVILAFKGESQWSGDL